MTSRISAQLVPIGGATQTIPLGEFSTLGSASLPPFQIEGVEIAERHCRIEFKQGRFEVLDLRSRSGTYLNGVSILQAIIQEGDILRLGSCEWTFRSSSLQKTSASPLQSRNEDWNQCLARIPHFARTDFPVLLLGPSGSGKEVLAETIHRESRRSQGPLVRVNCSALSETLIESELFGHIKGSFTDAQSDRKGAFQAARGGTLFLDEIGDLSYGIQAKLLRAIENQEIRPVGADYVVKTDVRIIAATHKDLPTQIQLGEFRSDLYFRLNVIRIDIPSLTQRMEDFDRLFGEFTRQYKVRFHFSAIKRLKAHTWTGNIRELKNIICRASAFYPGVLVNAEMVENLFDRESGSNYLTENLSSSSPRLRGQGVPILKELEKQVIIKRLMANKGNQRRTADDLGIPKSTLHDRLKQYEINPRDFQAI